MSETIYDKALQAEDSEIREIYTVIQAACRDAEALIWERIKDRPVRQRWIMKARIVTTLYAMHFKFAMGASEQEIAKEEQAAPTPQGGA